MVLHKYVGGTDTIFSTMSVPLVRNTLENFRGVIRRRTYQEAVKDSRCKYEPVSDLWPDIEPDKNSNVDGSSKEQYKMNDKEQEEEISDPHSDPRMLRRSDKIALKKIKSEIVSSKDKLFLIKNISAGSTHYMVLDTGEYGSIISV